MALDFTLEKYDDLCKTISKSNYKPLTVREYCQRKEYYKDKKFIILRHDVDEEPFHTLRMARIEHLYNIKSTYYFRTVPSVLVPKAIKYTKLFGHEIGYHYECMDEADGDHKQAINIFKENLKRLEIIVSEEIQTIAMHGSIFNGDLTSTSLVGILEIILKKLRGDKIFTLHDNRDLWEKYDFQDYGIIGEAYLSLPFDRIHYFTDTGRAWNDTKHRVKDNVSGGKEIQISNTDDLIEMIRKETLNSLCILAHPANWREDRLSWFKWTLLQIARNKLKEVYVKIRS